MINTSQQRFYIQYGFLSDMPVCNSSSGTREQSAIFLGHGRKAEQLKLLFPKYEGTDGSSGDEDSLENAESLTKAKL